jgi:predicted ATPase
MVRAPLLLEGVHLLTLVGPGGVGKTRVALEVAGGLVDQFRDGVFFVALGAIRDPNLVASAIAQTVSIGEFGGLSLVETLKAALRNKQLLLLLDTFDHLIEAAPLVTELLAACPQLKLLVTSRMVLRVRGENRFAVLPLTVPDPSQRLPVESMSQYQAVNLFVERARAVNPDFVLTNENAPAVAELCARLDGVPLAIELVAAQIELLTPKELLARLDRGLSALTAGGRDLPERQQSLQRAIDWSYDLLGEAEKRLFRRVSVFAGGCTLKTAQAVVSERSSLTTDDWLPATDMLGGMLSLVGNSLLGQAKQADGSVRFVMLKTIRNYALERLVESGEAETIRRQHALFFLELAEESELNLRGAAQSMWLDRLETEHDNLRAALTWAIESGDVQTSLQLAGTLFPFWYTRGYLSEGRRWLEVVLVRFQALEPTQALAKALNRAGFLA